MPRWFFGTDKRRRAASSHPATRSQPSATPTLTASLEANKAIVRRYLEEVMVRGDLTLIEGLFAPSMFERVRQAVGGLHQAFPHWQLTVQEMVAEGDHVAVHWSARGTHQGLWAGIPPTGKPMTWSEIYIMQLADGKIVGGLREANIQDVIRQLGGQVVAPEPAGPQARETQGDCDTGG
jgi:predicted ester cyclase